MFRVGLEVRKLKLRFVLPKQFYTNLAVAYVLFLPTLNFE